MTTEDDNQVSTSAELLRRLADEYGMDAKLPSVRELSQVLGVSEQLIESGLGEVRPGPAGEASTVAKGAKRRVGVSTASAHVRPKQIHIVLDPHLIHSPSASPIWGQLWGMLLAAAEQRSAEGGEAFTFHMSNSVQRPGPIRDLFIADLERGRVQAVVAIGLQHELVDEVNRYRVPVIAFGGAGNHNVATDMHDQIETVVGMLADQGCKHIELWVRGITGMPPQAFSIYDILDVPAMIDRLRDPYNRPAQRIATRANAETAQRIASFRPGDPVNNDFLHRLTDTINTVLFQCSFWDERVFEGVELRPETKRAIDARPESWEAQLQATRLLIQDVFPIELTRTPESESDTVNAFRKAMKRYYSRPANKGGEFTVRRIGHGEGPKLGNQLPAYNLARSIFGSTGDRPDGLIFDDDMIAGGAHKALEELGLRIGTDIRIATHANAGSPIGFGLHGRVIQMVFEPSDLIGGLFSLLDLDAVQDLNRTNILRVQARIITPSG